GFAENTDDLFVGKTLLHGDVLMWLMKTLLTSGCTNQRGAGHCLTCTSWHYSNSPKNRKTALSPRHDWLHGGSEQKKDPLRIWFFPQ
ncbi:hypothetical protein L1C53_26205, partial [Klebsiella pneumoniae]|uniref:hypothetical protein n=1 Tax=Klebsiella pneumoniae TaxID=573 RepID=UPI0020CDF9D9